MASLLLTTCEPCNDVTTEAAASQPQLEPRITKGGLFVQVELSHSLQRSRAGYPTRVIVGPVQIEQSQIHADFEHAPLKGLPFDRRGPTQETVAVSVCKALAFPSSAACWV